MPRVTLSVLAALALALALEAPTLADDEGWDEIETLGGEEESGSDEPETDDGWEVEDLGAPAEETAPATEATSTRSESFVRAGGEIESRLAIDTSFESSRVIEPDGSTRLEGKEDVLELRNRLKAHIEGALFKDFNFHAGARLTHWVVSERSEDDPFLLFNGEHYKREFEFELREAYIDWLRIFGTLDLRVGNQVVAWGANEGGLSPADRVNPTDMTAMLAGEEDDVRMPVFAVKGDLYFWGLRAEAVWVPFFKQGKMLLWGTDFSFMHPLPSTGENPFAAGGLGQLSPLFELIDESKEDKLQQDLITTELPEEHLGNSQAAFRVSGSVGNVDLAASVWYGFDQIPRFRFDPAFSRLLGNLPAIMAGLDQMGELGELMQAQCGDDCDMADLLVIASQRPDLIEGLLELFPQLADLQTLMDKLEQGELPLKSHFSRMLSVAGELSWLIDPVTLKIDVGFTPGRTLYTDQFLAVERMMLQTVVGLDYNYGQDFIIGVSAFHFSILDRGKAIDPGTGRKTGKDEEYIFFEPHSVGIAGDVEYSFGDDLEFKISLMAMYEIMVNDFLLAPEFSYAYDDHLSLAVGAILLEAEPEAGEAWFTGHDKRNRPMGYFSNNDHVYLRIRYAF